VLLAAAGALAAAICHARISETGRRRSAGSPEQLYARLLRNRRFLRFAAATARGSWALYIFLASSAFLLVDRYRLGAGKACLCYGLIAAACIVGTFAVRRLERGGGACRSGLACAVCGGALMLGLGAAGYDGPVALVGPMLLVAFGGGLVAPAALAGAMHAEDGLAGTGASLAGALQMLASGLAASLAAQLHLGSLLALGSAVTVAALAGLAAAPPGRAVM